MRRAPAWQRARGKCSSTTWCLQLKKIALNTFYFDSLFCFLFTPDFLSRTRCIVLTCRDVLRHLSKTEGEGSTRCTLGVIDPQADIASFDRAEEKMIPLQNMQRINTNFTRFIKRYNWFLEWAENIFTSLSIFASMSKKFLKYLNILCLKW